MGVQSIDVDQVVVRFRPRWEGLADSKQVPESSAVLQRADGGEWRLVAAASSDWVIPGFENIVFRT